jgi:plasmid stability protein
MATMIQIRNVPDDLHRKLKARAALAGMSLSDYLLAQIRVVAGRPTPEELMERLSTRKPIHGKLPTAELLRKERDAR